VFIGLADIVTDGFAGARLLSGDVKVPNEGYKVAYILVLCLGAVTTAVSLSYRLHNARLVRKHLLDLSQQGLSARASQQGLSARASAARRQAQQHEWELAQTHRAKAISSLALLSVAAQGALPRAVSDARARMVRPHGRSSVRLVPQAYRCPPSTAG
jgi:malic enzyme